ncbi:ATP-grasp domain-containing protein [Rhizobium miluonense]|jgi:biotin carboxylase|uniref:Biotin carboxylase n=1 Tax=Rhizobium miluonense TaxID=411945 RepID=A0ABU1SX44_9HYPH|nr:ATP-grasp domain-containing protein [Rhizobium miluonense]MDR6903560.1 biotin carboxylase [Rhizobium miluonense]
MVHKIALLRSVEVQQAHPYLASIAASFKSSNVSAKLYYTDGDCSEDDFPGAIEKLAPDVTPEAIVDRLLSWGAEGVISLSIPDENTMRDAVVKTKLLKHGIPTITHPLPTAYLLSNKWETKQAIRRHGLATPDGVLLDGDLLNRRNLPVPAYQDFVRSKCDEIGFPLLTKPLWDCLGNGIRYLTDSTAVEAYLNSPYNGNVVLEQCVIGQLCSVEIVGRDGNYIIQPLIWKGLTAPELSFPFTQVRHTARIPAAEHDFVPVSDELRTFCIELNIEGVVEVEMIYANNLFYIIEINPRVSGSTTLSIAASHFNTFDALAHMALGKWPEFASTFRGNNSFALQFPYLQSRNASKSNKVKIVRQSDFHINNQKYANAVVVCAPEYLSDLGAWIDDYFLLDERTAKVIEGVISGQT